MGPLYEAASFAKMVDSPAAEFVHSLLRHSVAGGMSKRDVSVFLLQQPAAVAGALQTTVVPGALHCNVVPLAMTK